MNDREQLSQCRTPAPPLTKGLDDRPPPQEQQGKGRVRRNEQKQSSCRRCPFHHLTCGLHLIDDVSYSCFHQKFFFSSLRMIKVFMQWYIQLYLLR